MGSNSWRAKQYLVVKNIASDERKSISVVLDECVVGRDVKRIVKLKEAYVDLLSAKSSVSNLNTIQLIDYLFPAAVQAQRF